jgi:hypothetical protein
MPRSCTCFCHQLSAISSFHVPSSLPPSRPLCAQFSLNAFVTVFGRGLDLAPGGRRKKKGANVTLRQLSRRVSMTKVLKACFAVAHAHADYVRLHDVLVG